MKSVETTINDEEIKNEAKSILEILMKSWLMS